MSLWLRKTLRPRFRWFASKSISLRVEGVMGVMMILTAVAFGSAPSEPREELYEVFVRWRSCSSNWWRDRNRVPDARRDKVSKEQVATIGQSVCDKWKNRSSPASNKAFREAIERAYPDTRVRRPRFYLREPGTTVEEAIATARREFSEASVTETWRNGKLVGFRLRRSRDGKPLTEDQRALEAAKAFAKRVFRRGQEVPPLKTIERYVEIADKWPDTDSASEALAEACSLLHLRYVMANDRDAKRRYRQLYQRLIDDRPDVITEWWLSAKVNLACSTPNSDEMIQAMLEYLDWINRLSHRELFERALVPMAESGRYTSVQIEKKMRRVFSFLGMDRSSLVSNLCYNLGRGWHPEAEKILKMLIEKYPGQRAAERAEIALEKLREIKAAKAARERKAMFQAIQNNARWPGVAPASQPAKQDGSLKALEVNMKQGQVREINSKPE